MEHKVIVVGIGPGSPDYLLPIGKKYITEAKVLVGSKRALETYANASSKKQIITGQIAETIAFIKESIKENDVVVMVSGDPGYYSLLAALREAFTTHALQVIPGISSMQVAFARLALPWQNAKLISLHGRAVEEAALGYEAGAILGLLTDTNYTTRTIAKILLRQQWPGTAKTYLCSRLSYEDEEIIESNLAEAAQEKEFSHCIMVVVA